MISMFLSAMNFKEFAEKVLPWLVIGIMVALFIVIVIVAIVLKKKPNKYTSDEIDRSVDAAAREKSAQKNESARQEDAAKYSEPVKEEQKSATEDKQEPKKEEPKKEQSQQQPKQELKNEQSQQQPKQELKNEQSQQQPKQELKNEQPQQQPKQEPKKEQPQQQPKQEPKKEQPQQQPKQEPKNETTKSVREALENDDEQEELTFEADDVDQPSDQKTTQRKISYRILYDKESKTWEIRKDNAKRVIRRVKTKKEALEIAQELSQKQDLNLVVHKKDGKFQKKR